MVADDPPDTETVLAQLLSRPEWHQRAACRGVDPNVFFPERGQSTRPARAYCECCSVASECGAAATARTPGIWGGTTGRQRQLRRGVRVVA